MGNIVPLCSPRNMFSVLLEVLVWVSGECNNCLFNQNLDEVSVFMSWRSHLLNPGNKFNKQGLIPWSAYNSNLNSSNLMLFCPSFPLLWCTEPSRWYAVFDAPRQCPPITDWFLWNICEGWIETKMGCEWRTLLHIHICNHNSSIYKGHGQFIQRTMQTFKLTDLSKESTKLQAKNKWGGVGGGGGGCNGWVNQPVKSGRRYKGGWESHL